MKQTETKNISFPGKHAEETVIAVIHRHWFDMFSHFISGMLMGIVLLGSLVILPALYPDIASGQHAAFFFFMENTFLLFLWVYLFLIWIDVYFDVWIITNERIVNIEQKGLFVRHISELRFSQVQDVTSEVEGIIPSILDYGEVFVQTAGEQTRFIFRNVPNPIGIKDLVVRLASDAREDDIEEAVKLLHETKRPGMFS